MYRMVIIIYSIYIAIYKNFKDASEDFVFNVNISYHEPKRRFCFWISNWEPFKWNFDDTAFIKMDYCTPNLVYNSFTVFSDAGRVFRVVPAHRKAGWQTDAALHTHSKTQWNLILCLCPALLCIIRHADQLSNTTPLVGINLRATAEWVLPQKETRKEEFI